MDISRKSILVAEDDTSLLDMFELVLKDEGYMVDTAVNGKLARELLSRKHYDLLITDLYMPNMNGIDLIRECHAEFPGMKVILISGGGKDLEAEHGERFVRFMGKEVETDMFLKKPCNLEEILVTTDKLLAE